MNINEIIENAKKDPSLFSTIDIENILSSVENEKNDYLDNKTTDDIIKEVFESVQNLDLSSEDKCKICNKLMGYRLVEEIHELFKGRHIRWIREGQLKNGGIVVDIKFSNEGIQILCKNNMNRFIQYKFDECVTYQKLTCEEELLLMAYEQIKNLI
jgi:DNA integrity scanning protein DisA with diadenylate cyclase activity